MRPVLGRAPFNPAPDRAPDDRGPAIYLAAGSVLVVTDEMFTLPVSADAYRVD